MVEQNLVVKQGDLPYTVTLTLEPLIVPDVRVVIPTTKLCTSRTTPAVAMVENPALWNRPSWAATKTTLAACIGAYKLHIQPFGLLDPWDSTEVGPKEAAPTLWNVGNRLASGLAHIREIDAKAPIILTLYGASWWMMHLVNNDGTVSDKSFEDRYSDSGRVKYSQLPKWLMMVDRAVELAALAGCRDFEYWNEAKGWYNTSPSVAQTWDGSMNTGGAAGKPAMGFSYFAKRTGDQVVATMTRLKVPRNEYRLAGPYAVLACQGARSADALPPTHMLYGGRYKWGYLDREGVNFTQEFLRNVKANKIQLDALALDASTNVKGDFPSGDPFVLNAKFDDLLTWGERALEEAGFDPDMDKFFSELYPTPPSDYQTPDNTTLRSTLWADVLMSCVRHGVRYPIMWGPSSPVGGKSPEAGALIGPDGSAQPLAAVFQAFRDHFGPGTDIFQPLVSDGRVEGLASPDYTLLINKTPAPLTVEVDGAPAALDAFGWLGLPRSALPAP